MKNIYIILFCLILCNSSCSEDVTYLETDYPQENIFAPAKGAMDEESLLRRDFFNTTGVYLLFNDTLTTYTVTSLSGESVVVNEIFNPGYAMTSSSSGDKFEFNYYDDIELQKFASDFVKEEILPKIPKEMHPFSFLLTNSMLVSKNDYGSYLEPELTDFYNGLQGTAVALGDVSILNEDERKLLASDLLKNIIIAQIGKIPAVKFEKFYNYSNEYYDIYSWNIPEPYTSVGLLMTYAEEWGVPFNSAEYDLKAYLEEVFAMSEEEFRAKYADSPACIEKMEELIKVLRSYGIVVYE
ncbi:hypothetical protein QUH73_01380 [Labilibaculum sp. K2S]|uniref:hypothetical protein n=1 Tax=Labilibaculum sp. K2S TaxID=3056386 RepID=UPI0025A3FE0E|nr:hypothetical protein [Labilibaculum sp. K2S]MDM8158457.1 hypothetical protein [Labilibaculum sp. K2S]